jgi:hypothetical protein
MQTYTADQARAPDPINPSPVPGAVRYPRHRPEDTVPYRLVEQHFQAFQCRPSSARSSQYLAQATNPRVESPIPTIVICSSDNGVEHSTFPHGGTTPFRSEKMTTWEGGLRVPMMVRWPGRIQPVTELNGIQSHEDVFTTLAAAAGVPTSANASLQATGWAPMWSTGTTSTASTISTTGPARRTNRPGTSTSTTRLRGVPATGDPDQPVEGALLRSRRPPKAHDEARHRLPVQCPGGPVRKLRSGAGTPRNDHPAEDVAIQRSHGATFPAHGCAAEVPAAAEGQQPERRQLGPRALATGYVASVMPAMQAGGWRG